MNIWHLSLITTGVEYDAGLTVGWIYRRTYNSSLDFWADENAGSTNLKFHNHELSAAQLRGS